MANPAIEHLSPDEYLAIEVRAHVRREYFEGRMYDMAGASYDQNFIVANLMRKISSFLDGKNCEILVADLRVATPQFDSFMYPDLTIVCEDFQSKENGFDTLMNPTAIIEVMSASTKGYDMAFKFHYYKQITSLQEYILVDSTRYFIQCNKKNIEGTWDEPVAIEDPGLSLFVNTLKYSLPLHDIYRKVSFTGHNH